MAAVATILVRDEIRSEEYEVNAGGNKVNVRAGDAFPIRPALRSSRSAASGPLKETTTFFHMIANLANEGSCRNFVRPQYVENQLVNNSLFFIAVQAGRPTGFLIGKQLKDKGLYLDVICGAPGRQMIDLFTHIARIYGSPYVQLSSLPNVLSYYPALGFQHRKGCGVEADVVMSPQMLDYMKNTMRQIQTGEQLDAFLAMPESQPLREFMMQLHSHGYTTKAAFSKICKNPDISDAEYFEERCQDDGFKMMKCDLQRGGKTRRNRRRAKKTHKNRRHQ
jgi:hypothetical protein